MTPAPTGSLAFRSRLPAFSAPAVLVLALLSRPRPLLKVGGLVIGAGALLFSADLAARHFFGSGLFPFSAPLGGSLMIIGWSLVAVAGPFAPRR